MILLTDKEIPKDTTTPDELDPKKLEVFKCGYDWGARAGAKAQLKKVVEWLGEICEYHMVIDDERRYCPQCMKALLEEVK